MPRIPLAASIAFLIAFGCTQHGVVGERSPCEPACGADEICHTELAVCVECVEQADCTAHDAGLFCADLSCVECRADGDCGQDAGACVSGRCQRCANDDDCEDDHVCRSGRCVDSEDEEAEDHEESES